MKKIKFMLFASAFLIAMAVSFAFRMPALNEGTYTVYHYDSDSDEETDMQNPDNWKESGPSCDGYGNVPCTISFENREALETFLSESSGEEILTASNKRVVTR